MATLRFEPLGLEVAAAAGESVFAASRRFGVPIATACTGNGNCGLCVVVVLEGAAALSHATEVERRALGGALAGGRRLSCQARLVTDDAVVRLRVGALRKL